MAKKWIKKAVQKMKESGTEGSLRKELGAKKGEPIPKNKLADAAKKGGKLGKRARFAISVGKKS